MITTSYFGNLKRVTNPLSISAKAPGWYSGPQFKVLAPKYEILSAYKHQEIDEVEYTECFKAQVLDPLNPQQTFDRIVSLAGPNATLLCYERPGQFCHRRIVADWLELNLGVSILELSTGKVV